MPLYAICPEVCRLPAHCSPCITYLRATRLYTGRHTSYIRTFTCASHTYDQSPIHRTLTRYSSVRRASPTSCEPMHLSDTASLHMASVRADLPDITHTMPVIRSPMHHTPTHRTPVRRASTASCGPMHLSGTVSLHMALVRADLPGITHTARATRSPGGGQTAMPALFCGMRSN